MLKKIIKKLVLGRKYNSETYVKYLKSKGVRIGKNCRIFAPTNVLIDVQNPDMLTLGDNVRITNGVIILTHDYSWSVCSVLTGKVYGNIGKVKIGNNCFIGMNSIILKNTIIGDNVIIGAGSIVSGKIDSNSVYAGNPAKKIMDLDKFIEKREKKQLNEAITLAEEIKKNRGRNPTEDEMFEYFWLFSKGKLNSRKSGQIKHLGAEEKIISNYFCKERKAKFNSFQDFLSYCNDNEFTDIEK